MPNAFAYVALLAWPIVSFFLFRTMTRPAALISTIVGGYLVLPHAVAFDLPLLPLVDKSLISAVCAAVFCVLFVERGTAVPPPRRPAQQIKRGREDRIVSSSKRFQRPKESETPSPSVWISRGLLLLLAITPFVTALQNGDPVAAGLVLLPGLTLYDGLSISLSLLASALPFLLAQRYLATDREHALLLICVSIAGLLYTLPTLLEVRMSPQMSTWVYGFLSQSFAQAFRDGGYRPVVFLQHGLWLAIFLAMAFLAAISVWRNKGKKGAWFGAAIWLLGTLFLCRSLGALAIALILLPVAFLSARWQVLTAAIVAALFVSYPMLRGAGLVPTDEIAAFSESINADRAQSLTFRLYNEDILLARANEKPLAGWGGYGRARVFSAETGDDISITDGVWIIVIGNSGWLGYISQFGLLAAPVFLLLLRGRRRSTSIATSGLCLVLAANMIDMIPNATLTPLTWLVSGALMGRAGMQYQTGATIRSARRQGIRRVSAQANAQVTSLEAGVPRKEHSQP